MGTFYIKKSKDQTVAGIRKNNNSFYMFPPRRTTGFKSFTHARNIQVDAESSTALSEGFLCLNMIDTVPCTFSNQVSWLT